MSSPDSREINLVRCLKCSKIFKCSRYDTFALLQHVREDHPEVDIVDTDTRQKKTGSPKLSKFSPRRLLNLKTKKSAALRPEDKTLEYDADKKQQHLSDARTENQEMPEQSPKQQQYVKDVDLAQYSAISEILEKYPEIKECDYVPHNPNAQVLYTRRYRIDSPVRVSHNVLEQPFQRSLYRTSIEKWCPGNGTIFCPKCGCNKRPLIKTQTERFTYNECATCCLLSCWPLCFLPWLLPGQAEEYLYCANCKTFLGLYSRKTNCIKPNRLYILVNDNCELSGGEHVRRNRDYIKHQDNLLENESSLPPSSVTGDSVKSKNISSIIINGKELPAETVARIQKYKKFGSLVGLDIDALTNPTDSPNSTKLNDTQKQNSDAAPSVAKETKETVRDNI